MTEEKSILVVDDEVEIRKILVDELKFHDYLCLEAGDGLQAFDLYQNSSIDLVITDIRMPKSDGLDLLDNIRQKASIKTPVVLVTGYSDYSLEAIFSRGAEALLAKPFKLEEFSEMIRRLLLSPLERWQSSRSDQHFIGPIVEMKAGQYRFARGGICLSCKEGEYKIDQQITINYNGMKAQVICRWIGESGQTVGFEWVLMDANFHHWFFFECPDYQNTLEYIPGKI